MSFITQGKTNIKYILIVIILAVIVGGGIWVLSYHKEGGSPYVEIPETIECKVDLDCSPCGSGCAPIEISQKDACHVGLELNECACLNNKCVIKDETANWKTYKNEEYGFELNYPDGWQVEDEKSFYAMPFVIFRFKPGCMFTVEVLPKEHADYNEVERIKKEGHEWKNITIADINGTMFEWEMVSSPPFSHSRQTSIYFNKENNLYRITRTVGKEGEWLECINTSDQILSTFQFLD